MENEINSTPVPVVPVVAPVFDPRRRIRELLTIPDRDRTDAEWDELNELEIQTAPGNRSSGLAPAAYMGKPNFPAKNRSKGKGPHRPGGGGGGVRSPQQPKPSNNNNPQKPRPA